jgi:hypothetical protein
MPSRRDCVVAVGCAALVALAGCGADTNGDCVPSFLRYANFGAPFMANWCRSCHSVDLPAEMRQQAPAEINFDNLAEIRRWSFAIERTTRPGGSMPPAGGPSLVERDMLIEWLHCGAP